MNVFGKWDVKDMDNQWVLRSDFATVGICANNQPLTLAIDAACDFMDRSIERNFPNWCQSSSQRMNYCFSEARRQR